MAKDRPLPRLDAQKGRYPGTQETLPAIDTAAEATIFSHFYEHIRDRPSILHRFSTMRIADTIVVMDRRYIIERSRHEELMAVQGRHAELFELQVADYRWHYLRSSLPPLGKSRKDTPENSP